MVKYSMVLFLYEIENIVAGCSKDWNSELLRHFFY